MIYTLYELNLLIYLHLFLGVVELMRVVKQITAEIKSSQCTSTVSVISIVEIEGNATN